MAGTRTQLVSSAKLANFLLSTEVSQHDRQERNETGRSGGEAILVVDASLLALD